MTAPDDIALVDRVIARARKAQLAFEASGSQERYDQAAQEVDVMKFLLFLLLVSSVVFV